MSRRGDNEISTLLATETIESIEATTYATISLSRGGVRVAQSSQQLFERWRVNRSAATSARCMTQFPTRVRLDLEFSVGDPPALCIAVGFWSSDGSGGSGTATEIVHFGPMPMALLHNPLAPRPQRVEF